jgi:hypothetical protein
VRVDTFRDGNGGGAVAGLIIFTVRWAAVFLVKLVSWGVRGERECSCLGSFSERVELVHGPRMCYPAAEVLEPPDAVW